MEVVDRILGAEKAIEIFGRWPSFHDAEIKWLRLDHKSVEDEYPPSLEMEVHIFEITSEVDPQGFYVLKNHSLAHLRFSGVQDLMLEGLSHQNVLWNLEIVILKPGKYVEFFQDFKVKLAASMGLCGSFTCKAIELVEIAPYHKNGERLSSVTFPRISGPKPGKF